MWVLFFLGHPEYLNIDDVRFTICKFRTGNNKLPVNIIDNEIPRHEKFCTLCNNNVLGDEFHFLLQCTKLKEIRERFIPRPYLTNPNVLKFAELMNCQDRPTLFRLAKYISICLKKFDVK